MVVVRTKGDFCVSRQSKAFVCAKGLRNYSPKLAGTVVVVVVITIIIIIFFVYRVLLF